MTGSYTCEVDPGRPPGRIVRASEPVDQELPRRSHVADHELVEDPSQASLDISPVLVRPVARLRSPIMEPRPLDPRLLGAGRPTLTIPPVRAFVRPAAWALLAAAPAFGLFGLPPAVAIGVAAAVIRTLDLQVARVGFSFADGFIGYRPQTGWPHGVQEDDEVHWNWSATGTVRFGQGARG